MKFQPLLNFVREQEQLKSRWFIQMETEAKKSAGKMFVFRKIEKDFRVAIIIWSQWTEDNGKLFEVSRFYLRERCRLLMDLLNLNFQTRIKRLNGKCENSEDSHWTISCIVEMSSMLTSSLDTEILTKQIK